MVDHKHLGSNSDPIQPSICGVIGNPVEHSLSPDIHHQFAEQLDHNIEYKKYQLQELELPDFISNFFSRGGTGLNVTVPFKQKVLKLVNKLTDEAKVCRSVNTLSLDNRGRICGDTTDGRGLILDLGRQNLAIKDKNILVVGAGGASVAVIYQLLKHRANITLHNRSDSRIARVIEQMSEIGSVNHWQPLGRKIFDGVICATSQFNRELYQPLLDDIKPNAFIYDLNYAQRATQTLDFFQQNGFDKTSDGYGMLVGQAAESYRIWHGELPTIEI